MTQHDTFGRQMARRAVVSVCLAAVGVGASSLAVPGWSAAVSAFFVCLSVGTFFGSVGVSVRSSLPFTLLALGFAMVVFASQEGLGSGARIVAMTLAVVTALVAVGVWRSENQPRRAG
ncbi:MAG: hypothetical protein R2752_10395 [Vicinamibacterales bacterium]